MAYFSNGSEGSVLDFQCSDCPLGAGWNNPNQLTFEFDEDCEMKPCPVAFVQMEYNYDQVSKGQEKLRKCLAYLVGDDGECKVRKVLAESQNG